MNYQWAIKIPHIIQAIWAAFILLGAIWIFVKSLAGHTKLSTLKLTLLQISCSSRPVFSRLGSAGYHAFLTVLWFVFCSPMLFLFFVLFYIGLDWFFFLCVCESLGEEQHHDLCHLFACCFLKMSVCKWKMKPLRAGRWDPSCLSPLLCSRDPQSSQVEKLPQEFQKSFVFWGNWVEYREQIFCECRLCYLFLEFICVMPLGKLSWSEKSQRSLIDLGISPSLTGKQVVRVQQLVFHRCWIELGAQESSGRGRGLNGKLCVWLRTLKEHVCENASLLNLWNLESETWIPRMLGLWENNLILRAYPKMWSGDL